MFGRGNTDSHKCRAIPVLVLLCSLQLKVLAQPAASEPDTFSVPKSIEKSYYEAIRLAEEKQNEKATEMFSKIREKHPNFIPVYFDLAVLAYDQNRYGESVKLVKFVLLREPNDVNCLELLGIASSGLQDHKTAIESYTKAIQLNSKRTTLYYNRGLAYLRNDQPEKPVEDCNKLINLDPHFGEAHTLLCHGWLRLKQFEKAIVEFDRAIAVDRTDSRAWGLRSVCYYAQGNKQKADDDAVKSLQLNPTLKEVIEDEILLLEGKICIRFPLKPQMNQNSKSVP
jgi:tetratricopeptide (TPR) repeat protein